MTDIRWLVRADLPRVLDIDFDSFAEHWGEDAMVEVLRDRRTIGIAAIDGEQIVGFCIYRLHQKFIEIMRLAVSIDCRRRGIGSALLTKIANKIVFQKREYFSTDVSDTNLAAHLFLKSCGLRGSVLDASTYRFAWVAPHEVRQEDQAWVKQCL